MRVYYITFLLVLAFGATFTSLRAQETGITITLLDSVSGKRLSGASISFSEAAKNRLTDMAGSARLIGQPSDTLAISLIGYRAKRLVYGQLSEPYRILLSPLNNMLEDVQVVSTGYSRANSRDNVGAADVIGQNKLDRSVSRDILSRIENNSPGLLFNHGQAAETDRFLVRGRSSISADARPLVVLDNFPYEGDLENINPNDIESVTVLKDALAASIWGARAANGVIVLTSKKGNREKTSVELRSYLSLRDRPDLYNISQISSSDLIDLTKELYERGLFDGASSGNLYGQTNAIPKAAEILIAGDPDSEAQLDALRGIDVRSDISRYLYRPEFLQQYNVNLRGLQGKADYFISAGYDKGQHELVGAGENRLNLRSNIGYAISEKLRIDLTTLYTRNISENGHNRGMEIGAFGRSIFSYQPYDRLIDDAGNPAAIYPALRKGYVDTIGSGRLLDWTYRPLEEIDREQHTTDRQNLLYAVGLNYRMLDFLTLDLKYQYENQNSRLSALYAADSYYALHQINQYSQLGTDGSINRIVPLGAIYHNEEDRTTAHQGRGQLNLDKRFADHHLSGFTGYEIRHKKARLNRYAPYYGYNTEYSTVVSALDFLTYYPLLQSGSQQRIENSQFLSSGTDNFVSAYGSLNYSYAGRYFVESSMRRDEANLFGVNTNQKGTPLWSVGGAWEISKEPFYKSGLLPYLKARLTYGVNGNISRATSAYTTMLMLSGVSHPNLAGQINNPPNADLRWEQVKMVNFGLEFASKGQHLWGRVDIYNKNSDDLLALIPTDATYGFSSVYANSAEMNTKGIDLQLNGQANIGRVNWQANLNYSHNRNRVTRYLMPRASTGNVYVTAGAISPLVDHPLYSVFSYRWGGLNSQTGQPQGYVEDAISDDYSAIYSSALEDMQFHGSLQPTHFGNLLNSFSYKAVSLSFNISYRFGGFFRNPSLYNSGLIYGLGGHGDYAQRWQQPGDELSTHVPAFDYTQNASRDFFYQNAEVHIMKSDVIRLEDINVSYRFALARRKNSPSMTLIFNAAQLPMLWAAAPGGIDPYFVNSAITRPRFSFGANLSF
ncbi:SusC/RagA family TonB-linked outer membrane protein [Sphingobacterium oryzagri]|uniref:SusC/RagA family TonB-linked outer membrane protein n=1 Tax=Sphingobacterium oryzagri TaxID=3025669 RepID=A0ABY7WIA4_9SPHI|nr:SusC/RagA family TonB-linked outer membrane protein [Sphingobacterium sp. KACC 22765]WDF68685.1 SusC/RagA family TonB-linked outer membrane protein [Sphingobacterium sp. KACC 22765]